MTIIANRETCTRSGSRLGVAAALSLTLIGCVGPGAPATTVHEAVHHAPDNDTTFPAVGQLANVNGNVFCSATLIGPRTVLTSAHCFSTFAQGCGSIDTYATPNRFYLSLKGDRSDGIAYRIIDISAKPGAYLPLDSCPSWTPNTCASPAAQNDNFGLDRGQDMVLLHITVDPGQPEPSQVATPMRVLTSIDDSQSAPDGAIHAQLDQDKDFGSGQRAVANVVGWGFGDDTKNSRRAGQMAFSHDANWNHSCAAFFSCDNDPIPPSVCPSGPFAGQKDLHRNDEIDVYATAPLYASTAPGDSGSPLVVIGGTGAGQVPELPAGAQVVLGTSSGGDTTGPGVSPPTPNNNFSQYSNTMTASARAWIESTLKAWRPCQPTTCAAQFATCGTIADGCGGWLDCGGENCPSDQTCGGGGVRNVCGTPPTCVPHEITCGRRCGVFDDGCGNQVCCGNGNRCCDF